jgi:hypothetical protein
MSKLRPMVRLVLLLAAALTIPASAIPAAAEEGDWQICEQAFYDCFTAPGHNLPWDIVECVAGYGYCKKYIEPLLGLLR